MSATTPTHEELVTVAAADETALERQGDVNQHVFGGAVDDARVRVSRGATSAPDHRSAELRLSGVRVGDALLVENDMLFSEDPLNEGCFISGECWPSNEISFRFHWSLSAARRDVIQQGVDMVNNATNVTLSEKPTPSTGEPSILFKRHATSTSSWVGCRGERDQVINVADWAKSGSVAHELLHALGLWHEQSRSDRDEHVKIQWDNIKASAKHNFEKREQWCDLFEYDFESIMHYGPFAFTRNHKPTILRLHASDPHTAREFGQRDRLSTHDKMTINRLYPLP
jgi:astacin (peptidase family M12A)